MYSLLALGTLAFLLSLFLTPLVRDLVLRWGLVVDQPGERKVHTSPIPRAGGIAVAFAFLGACIIGLIAGLNSGDLIWSSRMTILRLVPAAIAVFLIGLTDDLVGLSPLKKLTGEAAAAILAFQAGVHLPGVGGLVFPGWLSFLATLFWLLLCTNAVNLIDGVDGLAAGVGLFASTTTLIAALLQGNMALAIGTVPLVGALLGFLRYNFNPATIFLGDCGSLLIGFLLGCYGVLWSEKSATILGMTAPLLALAIPLLDTGLTVARRFLLRKPIFGADRGHIHHRLLDRGFTPRKVALLLYSCCALSAVCSLVLVSSTNVSGLVIIVFCGVTWIGIQHLGYVEFGTAGRMFVQGAFRRQLSSQIDLKAFQSDLARAETTEQRWEVLKKAATTFGFHRIRFRSDGRTLEHREHIEPVHSWSITVPLSNTSVVELTRAFDLLDHATAVTALVDTIRHDMMRRNVQMEASRDIGLRSA